jgi:glycosyltransferase involved in cell wall biosynthesis
MVRYLQRKSIRWDFQRYEDTRPEGLEPFSDDRTQYRLQDVQDLDYDILNLHWVAGFVDYRHFFGQCVGRYPVVWRLSDMNPFTGGCHYDAGCGKFRQECDACPQLGSDRRSDLAHNVWERKRQAFQQIPDTQLHFVAQSRWIRDQVQASPLTSRFPTTVIPNGLDTELFRPRDGKGFRRSVGIPENARVVLFVAQSVSNRRKGFQLLLEAVQQLDDVCLLSVGGTQPKFDTNVPYLHLGSIDSDVLLSAIYSSADLFVIPSLQDNLPNTVLEAMACGTPVVGFDTGGIPDMVRPGVTGWLAEVGNVRALREAIEQALSDDTIREQMGRQCREVVEEEYALEVQAKRYAELYNNLLNDRDI